jgi:hypothetical protein
VVEVVCTYALEWVLRWDTACNGAILLQCEQLALVSWTSFVTPGQKIDASAFDVMWADKHEDHRKVILSL